MKKLYKTVQHAVLMLLLSGSAIQAQWLPTRGPGGGEIKALFQNNKRIFAGTLTAGVHVSDDNGKTWQWKTDKNPLINKVSCFVLNNGTVFAGTNDGIYGSSDNGETWKKMSTGLTTEIKVMVAKSNILFAASSGAGLFKSTDNGQNWSSVQVASYINPNFNFLYVDGNDLYALKNELLRSSDNGVTWTVAAMANGSYGNLICMTRSKSNLIVGTDYGNYISADNGAKWITLQNPLPPSSCLVTYNDTTYCGRATISYTTDGGINWTALKSFEAGNINSILRYNGRIFAGAWDGIVVAENQGNFNELVSLSTSKVTSVLESKGRIHVTTKNGIYYSDDQCTSWKRSYYNPIFGAWCLTSDGSRLYVATGGGTIMTRGQISVYTSDDNGITWTPTNLSGNNGLPTGIQTISNLVENDGVIFAGYSDNYFYKSADKGVSWTQIKSLDAFNIYNLFKVKSADGNSAVLYACTNIGFYRSADNGITWTNPTGGTVNMNKSSNYVRSILRVGNELLANSVYRTHRSVNDGVTWTDDPLIGGSTNLGTTANMIEDNGNILVGSFGSGILKTSDGGKTWTQDKQNFPLSTDQTIPYSGLWKIGGKILLGTDGMGVWARQGDLPLSAENLVSEKTASNNMISVYPNPGRGIIQFGLTHSLQQAGIVSVYDLTGRSITTFSIGQNGAQWNTGNCAPGLYLYTFQSGSKSETGRIVIE